MQLFKYYYKYIYIVMTGSCVYELIDNVDGPGIYIEGPIRGSCCYTLYVSDGARRSG